MLEISEVATLFLAEEQCVLEVWLTVLNDATFSEQVDSTMPCEEGRRGEAEVGVSTKTEVGVSTMAGVGVSSMVEMGVSSMAEVGVSSMAEVGVFSMAEVGVSSMAEVGVSTIVGVSSMVKVGVSSMAEVGVSYTTSTVAEVQPCSRARCVFAWLFRIAPFSEKFNLTNFLITGGRFLKYFLSTTNSLKREIHTS